MHATLIVLIEREREEQKNNDIKSGKDLTSGTVSTLTTTEQNTFSEAYNVSLNFALSLIRIILYLEFIYLDGL